MRKINSAEEQKLIGAVEEAVLATKRGLSPNQAIQKVAEKYAFTPPFIEIITGAFNKSKAAFILKTATLAEKIKPFELADAPLIIKAIYGEAAPKTLEKVACTLPGIDFSRIDLEPFVEKVAAYKEEDKILAKTKSSAYTLYQKYASVKTLVEQKIRSEISLNREHLERALKTASEESKRLTEKQFAKVAQLVLNGYPLHGQKFLDLLCAVSQREGLRLEKTAHAAVFPPQEPYVSITKVFDYGQKLTKSENALRVFQKYAKDSFFQDMFANMAATGADGIFGADTADQIGNTLSYKDKDKNFEDELSPDFYNKLKEIDTRKSFMNLALYDPDLNKYEFPELIKAYNTTVQMVPEAYKQEPLLKNMMLKNLESGGLKDTFELGAELDLNKKMTEPKVMRNKDTREALKQKADLKKDEKTEKKEFGGKSQPGILSRVLSGAGEIGSKAIGGDDKGKGKKDDQRGDSDSRQIDRTAGDFMTRLARNGNVAGIRTSISNGNLGWSVPEAVRAFATWMNDGMVTTGISPEQQNVFDQIQRSL